MYLISETKTEQLIAKLETVFPNDTLKIKGSDQFEKNERATIVVQGFGTYHLEQLNNITKELELNANLKRSGTGISITFTAEN